MGVMESLKPESGISRSSGRVERTSMSRFSRSAAETIPAAASKKKVLRVCTPLEYDLQSELNLPLRSGVRLVRVTKRLTRAPESEHPIGCNSDYGIMEVESMNQTLEF